MRPQRLDIEGLRSFRTRVTIDFTDRNQIAIVGDTGAGKSSILDAITYALYRQTTFSKKPNQELMNASATQMKVVLTFCVSGQTWIVTRALKRGSKGVDALQPQLSRVGEDGKPLESVDGAADVDERIRSLIGLDGDAFLRTVVLPQGNFARLLISDTPAERATVLRQVWRTDELERAGEIAGEKADEVRDLHTRLQVAVAKYPENPDKHLKTLSKDHKTAHKQAGTANEVLSTVNAAMGDFSGAQKEMELCQASLRELEGTDASQLSLTLDDLEKVAGDLAHEHDALNEALAEVETALVELAQDDNGPSLAEVVKTIVGLDQIESNLCEIAKAADRLHGLNNTKIAAEKQATEARQVEENCQKKAEEHRGKREPLDDALVDAQGRRTDVEKQFDTCKESESNLLIAQKALIERRETVESLAAQCDRLGEDARANEQAKEEAEQALVAARQADCVASAAHGLHAGDECPICNRELPVDWQPVASPNVDDAERAARAAQMAYVAAQEQMNEVSGKLQAARQVCEAQEPLVEDAENELKGAMQALSKLLPSLGSELPEKEALLRPLDEKLDRALADLKQHDAEQTERDEALVRAKGNVAATGASAKAALEALAAAEQRFVAARVAVMQRQKELPKQFRPTFRVPDEWSEVTTIDMDDLVGKRQSAKSRQAKLEAEDNKRKKFQEQKNTLAKKQDELERKHGNDVAGPIGDLLGEASGQLGTIALQIGKLGLHQPLPSTPTIPPTHIGNGLEATEAIRSSLAELQAALDAVREAATKRIQSASETQRTARGTLAKFAKQFDVPEDDTEAIVGAAANANNEALLAAANAKKTFDDFSAIAEAVRDLRKVLDRTEAKERALTDLAAALKPGAFLKWLTLRRSHSLLSHASAVLKQMSSDRYAFAHPDEADSPWLVLDNDTGQARSPASLSGGEQFIASLALALGMVEMMARGGGKLESLFLDEGFGSLDSHNLDAAVEALTMVAARGRMVGVISHVRAVAEQFDNVLAVSREKGGSQADWLSDSERHELTADALAGLLE